MFHHGNSFTWHFFNSDRSAGREQMSNEMQALCFLAGANSIFYGEKLLTADNPIPENDQLLFKRLGLEQLQ